LQGNIKEGVDLFGVTGTFPSDGTAVAGEVKSDRTFYTSSATKLTGTGTKTLSADSNTVSEGYYEETTLSKVDTDLVAANIKYGVTIFGVTGTLLPGCVPKTGQTTSYATGDDGEYQKGCDPAVSPSGSPSFGNYKRTSLTCPSAGFTDNGNGTVTDNLTGLMWAQNASIGGFPKTWYNALIYCNSLTLGGHGDWRLPNMNELRSLFDPSLPSPYLPAGHPFIGVQYCYWTSTTYVYNTTAAWNVYLTIGVNGMDVKIYTYYVWPVRGGQ
jgi:Protein of unknown function (DUF1566)